jgi:hypothetical protein
MARLLHSIGGQERTQVVTRKIEAIIREDALEAVKIDKRRKKM